jgi:hypothetical protein
MTDDEIEAVARALAKLHGDAPRRAMEEWGNRARVAVEALDRVRDARGDDEVRRLRAINAELVEAHNTLLVAAARSPQGDDHEAVYRCGRHRPVTAQSSANGAKAQGGSAMAVSARKHSAWRLRVVVPRYRCPGARSALCRADAAGAATSRPRPVTAQWQSRTPHGAMLWRGFAGVVPHSTRTDCDGPTSSSASSLLPLPATVRCLSEDRRGRRGSCLPAPYLVHARGRSDERERGHKPR